MKIETTKTNTNKGNATAPKLKFKMSVVWWNIIIALIPFILFIGVNVGVKHYASLNPHSIITYAIEIPLLLVSFGLGVFLHCHYNNKPKGKFHFIISFTITLLSLSAFLVYSFVNIPIAENFKEPTYYHNQYNFLILVITLLIKYGVKFYNDFINLSPTKINFKFNKGGK